jgi:hypothetical protein
MSRQSASRTGERCSANQFHSERSEPTFFREQSRQTCGRENSNSVAFSHEEFACYTGGAELRIGQSSWQTMNTTPVTLALIYTTAVGAANAQISVTVTQGEKTRSPEGVVDFAGGYTSFPNRPLPPQRNADFNQQRPSIEWKS